MVTTVTNNRPQQINTSLFSLQKEIDLLNIKIESLQKLVLTLTDRIKKLEDKH